MVPRQSNGSSRRWKWIWIACGVVSALIIVLCMISDAQKRASRAAFQAALQKATEVDFRTKIDAWREEEKARPLMVQPDKTNRARMMNRQELAARLFPEGAPTSMPSTRRDTIIWPDAKRGVIWQFTFRDDGTHSGYGFSPVRPSQPPTPRIMRWREQLEPARRLWVGSFTGLTIGPILWVALLLAMILLGDLRRDLSHALLLVAWLCFLGWLVHPGYSVPRGILSNDMLFWGMLMLVISTIIFFVVPTRPRFGRGKCTACGYDLTGNVSGVCPECGQPIAAATPAV